MNVHINSFARRLILTQGQTHSERAYLVTIVDFYLIYDHEKKTHIVYIKIIIRWQTAPCNDSLIVLARAQHAQSRKNTHFFTGIITTIVFGF